MPLPLVLAGSIFRRVEPALISVWVALWEYCMAKLSLWKGEQTKPEDREPLIVGPDGATKTLCVGDQLHLTAVALKLPIWKALVLGHAYSYDLAFQTSSSTHTLKSLGLLWDDPSSDVDHLPNVNNLALGYEANVLPSFASCPPQLTDLQIVHGSCHHTSFNSQDGRAWVDDLTSRGNAYKDVLKRPQQLFPTGDQICADDVTENLLLMLTNASDKLRRLSGTGIDRLGRGSLR